MEVLKLSFSNIPELKKKSALCLGYFDGLHLGHRSLIEGAVKENDSVAVLTFDFSPKSFVLKRDNLILTSLEDKQAILEKMGVSYLLVVEVSKDFLNATKEQFIFDILSKLNINRLYCGKDFRFGKNKAGTPKDLEKYFPTTSIELLDYEGKKVSSRRVVDLLKKGDIDNANILLGRRYALTGAVVRGLGNGDKIGYKTANLYLDEPYFLPKHGVYICEVIHGEHKYEAICNIGIHPSIDELEDPIVEVHILNKDVNILGEMLKVELIKFIRGEKKFHNLNELVLQITKDTIAADDYFKK